MWIFTKKQKALGGILNAFFMVTCPRIYRKKQRKVCSIKRLKAVQSSLFFLSQSASDNSSSEISAMKVSDHAQSPPPLSIRNTACSRLKFKSTSSRGIQTCSIARELGLLDTICLFIRKQYGLCFYGFSSPNTRQ